MKQVYMDKKRILVLTDISSLQSGVREPDDTQSLIRLLLYADVLDIQGLIATYSSHGKHGYTEYIHAVLNAYEKDLPCLLRHGNYPSADALRAVVKTGNIAMGTENIGAEKDTEASEHIIATADAQDNRPLWIVIWGGSLDLAQALWKVKNTRSPEETVKFLQKLRVYAIGDQYDDCGPWIRENFPELFYITAYRTFRGMYRGGDDSLVSAQWLRENVCENHGALGALYPIYEGGDPWGKVFGIKEGDTPSYLSLISGIADPEDPAQENWGGCFYRKGNHYFDSDDMETAMKNVWKWREAYQKDFAARMDRCIK